MKRYPRYGLRWALFGLFASFITSQSQVAQAALYQTGLQFQLEAGKSSSYSGSGYAWTDLSGSGRTFTDTATPATFTSGSPSYFTFNGTTSYFRGVNGNTNWLGGNDFTVSAWINTTAVGGSTNHWELAPIIAAEWPAVYPDWGFGVDSNGKLSFGTGGPSADAGVSSTAAVNTGSWVFVTATRALSGSAVKLYINGTLDTSTTLTNGNNSTLTKDPDLTIGANDDGMTHFFNGKIGGMYGYNSVLTAAQVLQDYQATAGTYGFTAATSVTASLSAAPVYRAVDTITATLSPAGSDGYVSFLANGKAIPGCKKVASVSGSATCPWKPSTHSNATISVRLTPSVSYFAASSSSLTAFVRARSTTR